MLTNLLIGVIGLVFLAAFAFEVSRGRRSESLWRRLREAQREFMAAFFEGYRGVPRTESASQPAD